MTESVAYGCPVCGFADLDEPPWNGDVPSDDICPGCGTKFGYHDSHLTPAGRESRWSELREEWVDNGRPWTSTVGPRPEHWPPMTGPAQRHECPVCRHDGFHEAPWDGDLPSDQICPGCGIQFGYHDSRRSLSEREVRWAQLRRQWAAAGRPWTSTRQPRPENWPPLGTSAEG